MPQVPGSPSGHVARLEDPNFPFWSAAEVAEYICGHFIDDDDDLVTATTKNIRAEDFNGKKLEAIVEASRTDFDAWPTVVGRIIPAGGAALQRALMSIPDKLRLSSKSVFDELAKWRRVPRYDSRFPEADDWCIEKNGTPYFCPSGWTRYGIMPHGDVPEEEIFETWHVAYHGTADGNVSSIVKYGLLPPQHATPNGQVIKDKHGTAGAKGPTIYVSPSILYSSHWVYTDPQAIGKHSWLVTVFQVRVRPGTYRVQGNTLWEKGWPDRTVLFDPLFSSNELEWLLEDPKNLCVTGLMVKIMDKNPKDALMERFNARKALQGKPRGPRGVWSWNCDNANPLSEHGPWKAYDPAVSKKIEDAYQVYRDVCYLGKLGDNPYYIDFHRNIQRRADGERQGQKNWQIRRVKREVK